MKKIPILLLYLSILMPHKCFAQPNNIGSGISMDFDGNTGNYIDLGDSYNSLTFPFTVEAWVKLNSFLPNTSVVFASDNSSGAYTGCILHIRPNGLVDFAFGNNTGAGPPNRRDVSATDPISLHEWIHLAGVAYSSNDLRIYINGVQSNVTYDGTASYIASNSSHGFIGKRTDPYNNYYFDGEIDEVRLWDVGRSETEIRTYMCRKIDTATAGLIGYWKADESYTSTTVTDHTAVPEDGTIIGTVSKISSGAPIGDTSTFIYPSGWNGVLLEQSDASGDLLSIDSMSGDPYGAHIYLVKSLPYDTAGLDTTPSFYFGVFCAPAFTTPVYDVTYHYDFNDNIINAQNESTAALFTRNNGAVTTWTNAAAVADTLNNDLRKNYDTIRAEYILDVTNISMPSFTAADNTVCEKFCIDFTDQSTNDPIAWEWQFQGGAPSSSTDQNPNICYDVPGVYDVTLITTNANGNDTLMLTNYITVFPTPPFPTIAQVGYTLTSSAASSYQWQLNAIDIPGATNQAYDVLQSGYYTVIVDDQNGCVNSYTQYVLITGIGELNSDATVFISPNPSNGQFTVQLLNSSMAAKVSIDVVNALGQKVFSSEEKISSDVWKKNVDLSNAARGIYFIEIKTWNNFMRKKIVIAE